MANYNKLRQNFINTILERVNTENSLKEWIEPPKNSLFPPYSSEMEELAEVCNNVCFNAKQLSTKLEDYVNDLSEGHNFYGEKQLKEYYTELENLFKKFLEYKTKLAEIILMGNSDDNNESGMNESEDNDNREDVSSENSGVKWLVSDFGNIWFHKTKEEALETEQWLYQMHGEDENEYSSVFLKVPSSMTKEEAENILRSGEWKKYEEL